MRAFRSETVLAKDMFWAVVAGKTLDARVFAMEALEENAKLVIVIRKLDVIGMTNVLIAQDNK